MTLLTKQEVLALLPDNAQREISPSDVREIVHYNHVYGGLMSSESATLPQSISPSTTVEIDQWEDTMPSNGISASIFGNSLTVLSSGIYHLSTYISFSSSKSTTWTMTLFKNNSLLNPRFSTTTEVNLLTTQSFGFQTIIPAIFGDKFSLYIQHPLLSTVLFGVVGAQFTIDRLE